MNVFARRTDTLGMAAVSHDVVVQLEVPGSPVPVTELPRTGSSVLPLLIVGGALILVGIALALSARAKGTPTMRRLLALLLTAGLAGTIAAPGHADEVTVSLNNGGGSRVLHVEDTLGNPLTALDFGANRSKPFRVRVVDSTMDRTGFSVSATMTNLYKDTGSGLDWTSKIASSNVSIGRQLHPLNVLDVSATVKPLIDTVFTVTDLTVCAALSLPVVSSACTVSLTGLQGNVQSVTAAVNLSALDNLPLLPQAAETGAFDTPVFAGVAADAADKNDTPAKSRALLSGSPVSTTAVLDGLRSTLQGVIDGLAWTGVVTSTEVTQALTAKFGLLSDTVVNTILNSSAAVDAQALLAEHVLSQTGTYVSLPTLDVNVPAEAAKGSYKGTLVVTALQP